MTVITQGQITLYEVWDGQKGDKGDKGDQGIQGIQGGVGQDGKTYYTWIKYADTPTTGMSDVPAGKVYMGIAYNKLTATESTNYNDYSWSLIKGEKGDTGSQGIQGLQGEKGDQGIQGVKGVDGKSSYTHIAYATNSNGTQGFSISDPVGKTYIGMYVDQSATDSTDPSKYKWTLIKGADGSQGIQGQAGADGKTPYFHVAYATNSTGTAGFSTTDSVGKTYIGQYTDFVSADSTDPTKYSWTLIKGDQGVKGDKGDKGDQGLTGQKGADGIQYFTWLKYATTPTTGMSDDPTGKDYIGFAYNKTTITESTNYADYTWSLIKGVKGDQGVQGVKGSDGTTTYTWVKYGTSNAGAGMSDDPTGRTYIGLAYNKTTPTESTNPADYSWSLIKGDKGDTGATGSTGAKGDKGDQGLQGIAGQKGADGQTTYTWVKYADDELGNGMHDLPDGKRYLGLAYNKTTATESTNKADYSWSPLYDNVVVGGRNLLLGTSGTLISNTGATVSGSVSKAHTLAPDTKTLIQGKDIALSIKARTQGFAKGTPSPWAGFELAITFEDGEVNYAGLRIEGRVSATQEWTYYSAVTKVKDKPIKTIGVTTLIRNVTGMIETKEWQLEIGNVATDYAPAPEDVQSNIDGIAVGGRNILINAGFRKGTSNWYANNTKSNAIVPDGSDNALQFVTKDGMGGGMYQRYGGGSASTQVFEKDKEYTVTVWAKASIDKANFYFGAEGIKTFDVTLGLNWQEYSFTFKGTGSGNGTIIFYTSTTTNDLVFAMKKPKLEIGNRKTDFTEAPEDTQADIDSALSSITDMASDSKLTALEKRTIKKEWDGIVAEKPTLEGQATTYGITTEKTNFTNAYNTLNTFITPILSNLAVTSAVDGNTLRNNFKNYYSTKALLQKKITDTAKTNTDSKADTTTLTPVKNAVEGWTIGQINGKPAMDGNMIQKDTILATKLAVGSFENLFTNGSAEYGNIAWTPNSEWTIVNDPAVAYSGNWYFKGKYGSGSFGDFLEENRIQVREGEKYYLEGYFRLANAGTSFNARTFLIQYLRKDGVVLTHHIATGNLNSSWQKFPYETTVPAGATQMRIGISTSAGMTAGNFLYADSLFCKRMLTGELIVDGSIKAVNIDVANLMSQTAVINTIKATDLSGDRIKGGKISGVTYESINASNPKIKAVIENNSFKSYGASDGTKQNYAEMKDGGISVFQMAESGSPWGDWKAFVEPARFNAVIGSSYSVALEPTELRFWVPNMTGTISYDVVSNGASGYGLRLESNGGIYVRNKSNINEPALQFENRESIFFDGWGNMQAGKDSTQYATWSMKDADGRLRMLIPMGKGTQAGNEYHSQVGGHKFMHNGSLALSTYIKGGDSTLIQFFGQANFKYWSGGGYFECKNQADNGFVPIYASAFNTASSLVWKENIKNFEESALDVIMGADVMTYQYKQEQPEPMEAMESGTTIEEKEGHTHVGVIAEYAPDLVRSEDGRGVDSYAMVSLSWKAIQELVSQINELKAEIDLLKAPVQEANN